MYEDCGCVQIHGLSPPEGRIFRRRTSLPVPTRPHVRSKFATSYAVNAGLPIVFLVFGNHVRRSYAGSDKCSLQRTRPVNLFRAVVFLEILSLTR